MAKIPKNDVERRRATLKAAIDGATREDPKIWKDEETGLPRSEWISELSGLETSDAEVAEIVAQGADVLQFSKPIVSPVVPAEPAAIPDAPVEPVVVRVSPQAALDAAEIALTAAQSEVTRLARVVKARRTERDAAIAAWCSGIPKVTREQLMQDYVAGEQLTRRLRAEGKLPPLVSSDRPGDSEIDRMAFYSKGARYGARAGGSDSWRRGGRPTRGLKLPSARA